MPPLPKSFERPDLVAAGFVGWRTWTELRATEFADVPATPAVYVVFRPTVTAPSSLEVNPGGRFKGRDPTVTAERLEAQWVSGAHVIYVGKANVANRRLAEFARFGAGVPIGHWGGRYIWQLADSSDSLIAWHPISWGEPARDYEKRVLAHFCDLHGGLRPFANLAG
jgi:hypothetical protein